MQVQLTLSFDNYIESAHGTARSLIEANNAAVRGFRLFHAFVAGGKWADGANLSPVAGFLTMNAHMLFLAGAHTALQGHAAAIFPPLRTALENVCYAFLIARDPTLETVWIKRHQDEAAKRASRAAFTAAVRDTAAAINAMQPESGNILVECYEAAIDFGAHPNPRGLLGYLAVSEPEAHGTVVSLTALYGADAFDTQRALIGCLDFACVIALVMARLRPELTEALVIELAQLNEAKEAAIREFGLLDRRDQ